MTIQVRTVTAPDRRELERLVQLAIAKGWRPVGSPSAQTYSGQMEKVSWQQAMRRG